MVVASVLIMPALGDGLVKKQYLEKPGTWCDQVENAVFGNAVALGDLDGDGDIASCSSNRSVVPMRTGKTPMSVPLRWIR